MDIIQVITTLDTHWTVMHAEILEIEKDLDHCYQFQRRYGSQFWQKSVGSLLKLKSEKESAVSVAIKIGHSFSTPTHISLKSCFNITTTIHLTINDSSEISSYRWNCFICMWRAVEICVANWREHNQCIELQRRTL